MENDELQKQIENLTKKIKDIETSRSTLVDHFHTGFDVSRISWGDIYQRKVYIHHTIIDTSAATAANYGVFYIVPFTCVITAFKEVHQVAGNDAGAVTLDLEKLTGTQAPDAGVSMLASTLSLKATANTVQDGVLTGTLPNRNLAIGHRLCLKDTGTLTLVGNVTVFVELQIT